MLAAVSGPTHCGAKELMAKRQLRVEDLTAAQRWFYDIVPDSAKADFLKLLPVPAGDTVKANKILEHAARVDTLVAELRNHQKDLRAMADRVRESNHPIDLRELFAAPALTGAELRFKRDGERSKTGRTRASRTKAAPRSAASTPSGKPGASGTQKTEEELAPYGRDKKGEPIFSTEGANKHGHPARFRGRYGAKQDADFKALIAKNPGKTSSEYVNLWIRSRAK